MEDNYNNNFGEFLRNKLAESGGASDGWDRPDSDVRSRLQEQIVAPSSPNPIVFKFVMVAASCLVLALVASYIFHLQNQNNLLGIALENKNTQLELTKEQLELTTQKIEGEQSTRNSNKENIPTKNAASTSTNLLVKQEAKIARLQQENRSLASKLQAQNVDSKTKMERQKRKIEQLEADKTALLEQFAALEKNIKSHQINGGTGMRATRPSKDRLVFQQVFSHSIRPKQLRSRPFLLPKTVQPAEFTPIKRARQHFEIGYEYGLLGIKNPAEKSFEKQGTTSENIKEREQPAHSNGLFFAYSPKRNWWIRTGFRRAALTLNQQYTTGLKYDKSREYIDVDGNRSNSLLLTNKTLYAEERVEVGINIASNSDLENGDALEISIEDTQAIKHYQVPFGIEGFLGNRKLQWLLQGGIQWNLFTFDDYSAKITMPERRDVEVARAISYDKAYTTQFWSAYAGMGLNYRLTDHWHLRTAITYNYNFINNKTTGFSNSNKLGRSIKLGLNYRF